MPLIGRSFQKHRGCGERLQMTAVFGARVHRTAYMGNNILLQHKSGLLVDKSLQFIPVIDLRLNTQLSMSHEDTGKNNDTNVTDGPPRSVSAESVVDFGDDKSPPDHSPRRAEGSAFCPSKGKLRFK